MKIRVVYLGCFLTPEIENSYCRNTKNQYTISTTTFQRAFLSSFNIVDNVSIINAPDIGSWPKRSDCLRFRGSNEKYENVACKNVSFLNLTYFKKYSISHSLYNELDKWASIDKGEKLIIVYSLIYPYIKAAVDIKKKYPNTKICCIVLDLPEYFGDNKSILDKLIGNINDIYRLTLKIDSFILLTKQMSDALKTCGRPWLLMEGIYRPVNVPNQIKVPKTILYTGKLDARFGIRDLIDSFMTISNPEAQLWICGNGVDKEYVISAAVKDTRIKYYGTIKQDEVFKMQKRASILINPRRPEGEYTKYSFPSKTMEYMASGTPTVMYHLPGMPDEYLPYIEIIDDKKPKGLKNVLIKMLALPQPVLDEFGAKAKEFILNNKTSYIQMKRLKEFIENNYGK